MATKTKKQATANPEMKTYASDFTISLGPLQWNGSLVGIRAKESKPEFHFVSPTGKAVEQRYIEEGTGALFRVGELNKIFVQGDEETTLTQDEVKSIGESQKPLNVLPLTIHDAAEVDQYLFPDKNQGYVFVPDIKVPELQRIFNALKMLLASGEKALVGICNLQNHEGLFRLDLFRGHLYVHKQCYPAEIKDHLVIETQMVEEATEDWGPHHLLRKDFDAVVRMVEKQTQPFDPATYKNAVAEKQFALLANPHLIKVPQAPAPNVQADVDSFLAAFGD